MAHQLHNSSKLSVFLCELPKKPRGFALTIALTMMLLLEPCLELRLEESLEAPYGGTLQLGWYRKPAPLNPFQTTDTISAPLMDLIFNKLVRFNPTSGFEPDLAKRWEISEDGLTYTFHLRRGVKFHDGSECTAKDVLHTFQLMGNKSVSPTFYQQFEVVKEWRAPSDFVFQMVLKRPFSPILVSLWRAKIVPRKELEEPARDLENFVKQPVGTGPFMFESQEEDGSMWFKANPDYFEGKPYLDEVHVKIFPNKGQVWSAFLRGEVDMLFYLDSMDREAIKDNPSFNIFRALAAGGYMLMFNLQDPLLSNPKIRKAVSLAVNRREIIQTLERGEGIITDGPFHPFSWANNPSVKPADHDPEGALALLQSEGFTLQGDTLEKEGKKLVLNLLVDSGNEHLIRIAKLIRQQLQEIGIRMNFHFFSNYQELFRKVYEKDSEFQCYLSPFNVGVEIEPDPASIYWDSASPFNLVRYQNIEIDYLFELARKTHHQAQRARAYQRIHEIIAEEKPAVFLYIPYVFYAASKQVFNAEKLAASTIPFYQVKKIYKQENS